MKKPPGGGLPGGFFVSVKHGNGPIPVIAERETHSALRLPFTGKRHNMRR
jgi:hypothetical protein